MKKKTLMLTGVLLALTASLASAAAGLSIGWAVSTAENTCPSSVTSLLDKTNACTSNSGASVLIGSIVSPGVPNVVGELIVIDMQESGVTTLSDWWNFDPATGCRGNIPSANTPGAALSASFDPLNDEGACLNLWQTTSSAAAFYQLDFPSGGRARWSMAVATAAGQDWLLDKEWYSFRLVIDNRKTVAPQTVCSGCLDGACITFQVGQINSGNAGQDKTLDNPATTKGQSASYRGGGILNCATAAPTRRATWGQVKSLYR